MLLATEQMGMTKAQYGTAFSWGALTTMIASVPLGLLFNRFRNRQRFCIGATLFALVPLTFGLFFMKTPHDMGIFFALREFMFIVYQLNFIPLIIDYTTPRNVATILGFTTAVNGLVRFTMTPFAGLLVDVFGKNYKLPLWGGYLGVIVCFAAFMAMRPPEKVRHLLDDEA
jgi:MFS family permease